MNLDTICAHYSQKILQYGPTARGAGWKNEASQTLRFEKLTQLLSGDAHFTINDLGCGYGALFEYCATRYDMTTYVGYDISEAMLEAARERIRDARARFLQTTRIVEPADYSFASGIFNVKLDMPESQWAEYVWNVLDSMYEMSVKGFAFNCMTTYVDFRAPTLFYADPLKMFDHCRRNYSPCVALLHDYPLFEFTILVTKVESRNS